MIKVDISKSKFKVRHLKQISSKQSAYQSPLAVISHIDVNAFFAQVEQIRTGLTSEDAVVCVQWSTLIAVSYAARDFGVNRMDTLETAKLKCPSLKPIHTAVFRKGENYWRYHDDDDKFPDPAGHKVSLDPYRRESRKLLSIIKARCDMVEKASVDECFIDMGRLVLEKLFELVPNLADDLTKLEAHDELPPINGFELPIHGVLIDEDDPIINDYDDLLIVLGSIIMNDIRHEIKEKLGYTTSCGIAKVKTVAKLASGFKKPDNQTIVRNSKIPMFLDNFKVTDFWSMGGKTGEFIVDKIGTDNIEKIRTQYDLHDLTDMVEDDQLAQRLYQIVRGDLQHPLSERIVLKSMNSNKNMRGSSGKTYQDAIQWIRVFAADLKQRIVELNDENGQVTRTKTLSISFKKRDTNQLHSKQNSIPMVPVEELEDTFYKYGINILKLLEAQYGNIYPLSNLNMTISNFEIVDGTEQNILNFTKKGDINSAFKDNLITQQKNSKTNETDDNDKDKNETTIRGDYSYSDDGIKCLKCNQTVEDTVEHTDYHLALKLMKEINGSGSVVGLNGNDSSQLSSSLLRSRSTPSKIAKVVKKTAIKKKKNGIDKTQSRLPF